MVGAPHFFSSTTLRPLGPRVTLTASASVFMPRSRPRRASSLKAISFGITPAIPHAQELDGPGSLPATDDLTDPANPARRRCRPQLTGPFSVALMMRVPASCFALDHPECKRDPPQADSRYGERMASWLADTLHTTVPLVLAPMAGPGKGRLAHAVSAAGGFGMFGVDSVASEEWIREQRSEERRVGKESRGGWGQ